MERINILCLSDAHITRRHATDQKIVLDAFIKDLAQICDTDLAPHYVVFSGDLVNDPDEDQAYDYFMEMLLIPILETTSIDLDSFVFGSGNHDVSRKACEDLPSELDMIGTRLGDHKYFNDLYAAGKVPVLVRQKVDAYAQFMKSLSATQAAKSNPFYNIWDFPTAKLAFVALNSSAFSVASLKGNEHGRLNFPDLALNEAFGKVLADRHIISLQHHPLAWFQDDSASELQRTINHKSKIHLFGHLHRAEPATLTSPLGSTAFVQAPSLFSSRNYLNGYCIISLAPDRTRVEVTFQTYFDNQRAFRVGENVAPQGVFYVNTESKNFWVNQPLRINLKRYRRWLAEVALVEKLDYFNETTTGKKLSDVFVCPPLARIDVTKKEEQTSTDPFTYTRVLFERILDYKNNVLIFCPFEHGQTSLARQIALNYLLKGSTTTTPRLPLIIDCANLRNYPASFIGLLKAQAPDLTSLGRSLDVILAEGLALIIFENVSPTNTEQNEFIRKLVENFHRNQFIILVRSTFSGKIDALLELEFPNITDTLHVQAYSRSQVREFIRRSKPPLSVNIDVALDQIIARFRQLGLPLTPVYLSLLFRVFEQDASFQPTNTASLVENFVEKVLGKAKLDARREVFDYHNRVGLLAYLAQRMTETNVYSVDFAQIYSWCATYLNEIGFEQDIQGLIRSFCDARLFSLVGNNVQFQHDMFLAYFAAQRMVISRDFELDIINSAHRFPQEIDIYCGLKRFDDEIIEALEKRFLDVDERLGKEFPGLPGLPMVDGFELPRDKSIEAMFASVTEQLLERELTDKERDELLDHHEGPEVAVKPRELARPEVGSVAIEWFTTLRVYTIALKNLEEIGAEKKSHHLSIILNAWGRLIGYVIVMLRTAFDTDLKVGGATINLGKVFGEMKPFVLRSLLVGIPNLVSALLRDNLGTEKLRLMLAERSPAGNESITIRFLNEGLYLDLRLPEFIRRVESLRNSLDERQFFCESLFVKLLDGYVRFPLQDEALDTQYRRLMADLSADVTGARGAERSKFISKQLQDYKKDQLISKLKTD